jgi:hypothetical protein
VSAPPELSDPKDPKHSRVQAVVAGFNSPAVTKVVSLIVNGKAMKTQKVNVPANGRATLEFSPLDVEYGFNRCEVRIENRGGAGDAFPADDASVFAVRRSDPERVLFVHAASDTRSAVYFAAALNAAAQTSFVLQSVAAEQSTDIDPSRFSFVVLSDAVALPPIFEHTLDQYVTKGGNVFIAIGTRAASRVQIPVWGANVTGVHDYVRAGNAATVGKMDFTHPALAQAQPGRDNGGWAETKVFYAAAVEAGAASVVARLSDGTPLLLDKQVGEGRVLLFTSGLENLTNDLPLHPVFVAFVDQTARYLSGDEQLRGSTIVDSFVQLRAGSGPVGTSTNVEVLDPDGNRPFSLSEARTAQTLRLARAGFYQIHFANGRDAVVGVNPDRRESDLTSIPDDILELWSGSAGGGAGEVSTQREVKYRFVSLWWWVMLLALALLVAESTLASGYMSTQREEI